jgi:hypothetical protein
MLGAERFNDWVVTIAFYSALHFVRYKIFPLSKYGEIFSTFDDYASSLQSENKMPGGKHSVLAELVEDHIPQIAVQYRKLLSLSMTARYRNYNISSQLSKEAVSIMQKIKTVCSS